MLIQYLEIISSKIPISLSEGARLVLVYSHLLFCAFAITMVIYTDLKIAMGSFTRAGLQRSAHQIAWILFGLWATGLTIIYLDTGFDPEVLAGKSKLLFKLVTVAVLTVNGFVLHMISFPVICGRGKLTLRESFLLAVTGSLSTSHWLLAAFVGIAKPLGRISFESLMFFYAFYCFATVIVALMFIPALRTRLTNWRAQTNYASSHTAMQNRVVDIGL